MTQNNNDNVIRQYLKEISSQLDCERALKKVFLNQIKIDIETFEDVTGKDLTMENISEEFGPPESLAKGLFDRNDYEELLQKAKKKIRLWKWIGTTAAVLAVAAIVLIICIYVKGSMVYDVTDFYKIQ